jgi:uncharacterized protein (DUF2141 family)
VKALLLVLSLSVFAGAQVRNGSIIGVVSDSVSHHPLRNVLVSLEQQQVSTDDAGSFAFHDLKPGQYRIAAERSDYPTFKEVTASPSEDPDPVHIELVPGAIVSGRILDEDGDPLAGCSVQTHPAEHRELIIARSAAESSEYRLFGLPAGKYVLAVQCGAPVFQPRPFSAGPDPQPSLAYPLQFYPSAPDAASAETIELAPGIEKTGVDFRMRPAHVTQVRAVIAPLSADWRGRDLFGGLIQPTDLWGNGFRRMTPDSAGSAFLIPQVFPGSYDLLVITLDPENRMGGIQRVEVKDQPVNTVIELKRAIDIHGTVELESSANSSKIQLSKIYIQLMSDYPQFMPPLGDKVKPDGSFAISAVIPMRLRVSTHGASVFIKSVWLGSKELSGNTLDLSSGSADILKIVLSANTASIHGTAPPGTIVAFRNLDDKLLSGSRPVEQSGQFRIEGLAPGRYRVSAGEDGGSEITVQEGETVTVDLTN